LRIISNPLIVSALFMTLTACSSGTGRIELAVGASSQLTADDVGATETQAEAPRLLVTVARVDVHVGGDDDDDDGDDVDPNDPIDPNDPGDDDGDGGGWITVFTGPLEVDLADAASGEILLGGAEVPVGRVTQIRLILDGDARLVTGEESVTVACPSCTQTGIKIVTRGQVVVEEDETIEVDLIFDTVASVIAGLDGLRLSPVIRLEATAD
jgi:hypothetical protein